MPEYLENLKKEIEELAKNNSEALRGTTPEFSKIEKPTGLVYRVIFKSEDKDIAPSVNLEAIADCMKYNDCDLEEALDIMFDELERDERTPDASYFTGTLADKDRTLNAVSLQMVPMEATDAYLSDKITTPVADMKAMCVIANNGGRVAITKQILENLALEESELIDAALENQQIIDTKVMDMKEVLREMGAPEEFIEAAPDASMIVITSNSNGASVILNDEAMQKAAEKFGSDKFVILPSSIFEVIAIPYVEDYEKLESMIQDVNAGQVAPEDRLSDKPYIYDVKTKTIEMFDKEAELDLE